MEKENENMQVETIEYWRKKYEEAEEEVAELKRLKEELEAKIAWYEEQYRLAKQQQFGRSSEKTEKIKEVAEAEVLGFFNEAENEVNHKLPEPEIETITYKRRKRVGKREEDLSDLEVETIEYTLPESDRICPECGGDMHTMSKEIRKELKIIPAQVKVVEHVRYIYTCRACEKTSDGNVPIIKAEAPEAVIKGSLASPSIVGHIISQKYVNAVPLYRQEQGLMRDGILISRQNMANWVIRCAEDWFKPVYECMRKQLLLQDIAHADETVVQVLHEPGKKAETNSYMWLYRTGMYGEHHIVLYEYQATRSGSHPKQFLSEFAGYLHVDGYEAYHSLPNIKIIGCWVHLRRKFDDALKAAPEEQRAGSKAQQGLEYCNQLFKLEREYESLTPEKRFEQRLIRSKPIAEDFFAWAKTVNALPKSLLGKAIHYLKEQWPYLVNVFLDGRLELSNNRAERSIRPFVIGRNNWLFCNTQRGAKASSIIYSLVETAKENGLRPYAYFEFLLETMPNITMNQINDFMPWSPSLPEYCKVPVKQQQQSS
jgi:transposase